MADKNQDKEEENKQPAQPAPPPSPEPQPKQPKKQEQSPVPPEVSGQVDEVMRRIRLLEERYSQIRKKSHFTEENMLDDTRELFSEINALNETISELRTSMADMSDKLSKLGEEVGRGVSKAELNVISKYLDFWQPMEFMTRQEAEKLLRRKE